MRMYLTWVQGWRKNTGTRRILACLVVIRIRECFKCCIWPQTCTSSCSNDVFESLWRAGNREKRTDQFWLPTSNTRVVQVILRDPKPLLSLCSESPDRMYSVIPETLFYITRCSIVVSGFTLWLQWNGFWDSRDCSLIGDPADLMVFKDYGVHGKI